MPSTTVSESLISNNKECSGCYACYNVCPKDAITMELNDWGFCISKIKMSECIKCGKCTDICPQLNTLYQNDPDPLCYAVKANEEVLKKSSSGGVFSLLYDTILAREGFVCGPIYDENMDAVFKLTNNLAEIEKMQGSKYIFSDMGKIYKQVKEKIDSGKLVMFTGCPCQIAGIKNFIGNDDKLITVDLLCAGLPSKRVFRQYIKEISNNKKITDIQFRSKKYPYGTMLVKFDDGSERVQEHDPFVRAFLTDLIKPNACANCLFANTPRQGDISIGDLWGAAKIINDTNLTKGISCVLVNNSIGMELFDTSVKKASYCQRVPLSFLKQHNRLQQKRPPHLARSRFFHMLNKGHSVSKSVDYSLKWKFDVGVTGFWRAPNYGGTLTYYALYNILLDLGLEPIMIEARFDVPDNAPSQPNLLKKKYPFYHISRYHRSLEDEKELNNRVSKFVVGSDQVWNKVLLNQMILECYAFDYVNPSKKKISISSSFGSMQLNGDNKKERKRFIKLLKKFDSVSVREDCGVEICKKLRIEATRILDPVMLCNEAHYMDMISNSSLQSKENYIFNYSGYTSDPKIHTLQEKLGYDIINVNRNIGLECRTTSNINFVEDWVKCLYDSSFVITDSFHAVAFSILFKKPFILFYGNMTEKTGLDRFTTILNTFDLGDRLFKGASEVIEKGFPKPINWDKVHSILEKERERSMEWIKEALLDDYKK